MKNNTKFFISTIFIIIAFFLGYLVAYLSLKQELNKEHYIEIEELKTKYKLSSSDKQTYILYNDEKISNLDIKK
ncbi:MAG: hypothetical protein N4A38_05825 [Candidatus Gracilibacteria bacterium]|nr:hypothetical protein [Candidatus Gracilibacteria bacterium]